MDDWDFIEKDLKQLEDQFSTNDEFLEKLSGPSAADYWRRRNEAEKELFSKMLETKEQEKIVLESKITQTVSELTGLQDQISKLEKSISEESQSWQERLKVKETELVLQKERVDWVEKVKSIEYQNKILQEELDRTKQFYIQELENAKVSHTKELEELIAAQNILSNNFELVDQELKHVQTYFEKQEETYTAEKNDLLQKISSITSQTDILAENNNSLEKKNMDLMKQAEAILNKTSKERDEYRAFVDTMINEFVSGVREHLGSILGITEYSLRTMKPPKFVKKELDIINKLVGMMLDSIKTFKI